jgi:glycosyltransferase involved in cell wall biosynthesis
MQGGIITVFPQLAATVGLRQRFARKRFPVVAWWFNVGTCYTGVKAWLARNSVKDINRFIVHTRCEAEIYSQWLGLPLERFEFVPLQVAEIPVTYQEETERPFILSTGSACRDYPTLFDAVKKLNLRTVVVSGPRALAGLTIPSQVEAPFDLNKQEILRLGQEARINIVPMTKEGPTAGTVTIVEAMRMGRAVIATRRSGIEDYIIDGETGILVEPHSVDDLAQAIDRLWNDHELRDRLGKAAYRYAAENFSDEAAGTALGRILDSVEEEVSYSTAKRHHMLMGLTQ